MGFRKIRLIILAILFILPLSFCGGSGKSGDSNSGEITKEKYMKYLQEVIDYYKTNEYQEMAKKYKEEAKDVKKLMDRQKVWEKYMGSSKEKVMNIQKKYGISISDLFKLNDTFNKDPKVRKLIFEMAKYIVF